MSPDARSSETAGRRAVRVQVVCSGNTCRSPMAELVLRDLLSRSPAGPVTLVSSAGLLVTAPGGADPEAVAALHAVGIDGSAHRVAQFEIDDIIEHDLVIFVEQRHLDLLASAGPPRGWRDRVRLLRTFDPVAAALHETDLPDPSGCGPAAYAQCLKDIRAATPRLVTEIERLTAPTP